MKKITILIFGGILLMFIPIINNFVNKNETFKIEKGKSNISKTTTLKSISLIQNLSLNKGDSVKLNVVFDPIDFKSNEMIEWKTNNPKSVIVDENGVITAINFGSAQITATLNGISANCNIFVKNPQSNSDEIHMINYQNVSNVDNSMKNMKSLDEKEEKLIGWQIIDNKNYYYDENGVIQKGIVTVDNNKYIFNNDNNELMYGLINYNDKLYYSNEDGILQSGLIQIEEDWYYFDEELNEAISGLKTIDEVTYYFDYESKIRTNGIITIDDNKYIFNNDTNELMYGLINYNDKLYYSNKDGILQSGLIQIEEDWYYFDEESNEAINGFKNIGDKKYYFDENYKMIKGWLNKDNSKYYMDLYSGVAVIGNKIIDGIEYKFEEDGTLKNGWITRDGKEYFIDINDKAVTGWQTIMGEKCYFNNNGELIGRNVKKVIDISEHQGDIDWDTLYKYGDIDGVILRIGYGNHHFDKKLERNIEALKRLGIPYGIYIFSYASKASDGYVEADTVLQAIRNYNMNPTLGIYYDLESFSNDGFGFNSDWISKTLYDDIVYQFMSTMNNNGYYNTYIYANLNFTYNRFNDYARSYVKWIAEWNSRCHYNGSYHLWQYTSKGSISGISGNVDISVLF